MASGQFFLPWTFSGGNPEGESYDCLECQQTDFVPLAYPISHPQPPESQETIHSWPVRLGMYAPISSEIQ